MYITLNKSEEQARRLAYVAIRNVLGAILFLTALTISSILDVFFSFTNGVSLSKYRFQGYAIGIIVVFAYLSLAKKYLLPELEYSEAIPTSNDSIKKYNRMYVGLILCVGLGGGLVFVCNRLLNIYF